MNKLDIVDALADVLDGTVIEGLGSVLATADSEDDGTLVLEVFGETDDVFLLTVKKYRPVHAHGFGVAE